MWLICSALVMAASGKNPKTPITPALHPNAKDVPSFRKDQGLLKADCLRREGYRCALTGMVDGKSRGEVPGSTGEMVITQCAHILPFAFRSFDEQSAIEVKRHPTVPPPQTPIKS